MERRPTSPPPSLIGRLEIETPEHVRLEYELAGIGSRLAAAVIDLFVLAAWAVAVVVLTTISATLLGSLAGALGIALIGLGSLGYFTFFEAYRQGQTPGKRSLGIRVVRATGHPVTFGAAFTRNLLRLADFLPPPYLSGLLLILFHPKSQRLGDIVAGTVVVRDRPDPVAETSAHAASRLREQPEIELVGPALADDEWRLLSTYRERAGGFDPAVRARLEAQLSARFAERFPVRPERSATFLEALHRTETARRAGRLGAPLRGRAAAGRRLADQHGARWTAFEGLAARAARDGLDSLAAAELPDFAARYREVAADLARARTYGADVATRGRLERLAAAGHNQLYTDDRRTLGRIATVIFRECPAAVWRSRGAVALALVTLFAPAFASYIVIRERPALAEEVLPDGMLERASAGHARQAAGHGYFEAAESIQPLLASSIISNNVRVSFNCFASGIFLGVGSLVLLAYNGLELGATAGHFANQGLLGYLLTFIIGHGVLELFAIAVSGAAGLLLGTAILAPGDLSRSEALVVRGRVAVRMVGAVVVLLIVAGTIEGMASASDATFAYRAGLSSASAVFLLLYLLNGARWAATLDVP